MYVRVKVLKGREAIREKYMSYKRVACLSSSFNLFESGSCPGVGTNSCSSFRGGCGVASSVIDKDNATDVRSDAHSSATGREV